MQETFFSLLTNEESRNLGDVEASLDNESSAGESWFDRAAG